MNTGDETIAGTKTFSSTIAGDINGNAATVTNGIYTTSSVADLNDVSSVGSGAIITSAERTKYTNIEALADVTDATNVAAAGAVMNTGNETIAGTKTFSSTIVGDINGNAATVTNGIYTSSSVTDLSDVSSVGSVGYYNFNRKNKTHKYRGTCRCNRCDECCCCRGSYEYWRRNDCWNKNLFIYNSWKCIEYF